MFVKEYTGFSLSRLGARSVFLPGASWGVYFRLDCDVSSLFPYINATLDSARLFPDPTHIQFIFEGFKCTMYPGDVIAASFDSEEQARGFADNLVEFLNGIHEKRDTITPDHRKYRQIHVMDVYKLLPRTNCGDCGCPTCMAFAAALSNREAEKEQCPGFAPPIAENAVYPVYDSDGKVTSTFNIEISTKKEKDAETGRKTGAPGSDPGLTERETEVLSLVAEGATNKEISERLFISPHTVKSHVIHIFNKLGVNDRTQAAVWAAKNGIV